jgi:voltage-gated potassium channel
MLIFNTIISFIKDKKYRRLLATTGVVISIGSVVYHYVEGWSWLDSIYFSFITLSTIGFGDFYPVTPGGKIFTIFYIIIGIGIILTFINTVYEHYTSTRANKSK